MDDEGSIFDTDDDIDDISDPDDDDSQNDSSEDEIMDFYRGCSAEELKKELENDPLLRAYIEKINEIYGQGNAGIIFDIKEEGYTEQYGENENQEETPEYTVCSTSAERDRNGLFLTVLKAPYSLSEYGTANIIVIPERENWYAHIGRSVEWQTLTDRCPMFKLGMNIRFYGTDRALKRAKRKSSYWRNQNVIVETEWLAGFRDNSWYLIVRHTQPILAVPAEMFE